MKKVQIPYVIAIIISAFLIAVYNRIGAAIPISSRYLLILALIGISVAVLLYKKAKERNVFAKVTNNKLFQKMQNVYYKVYEVSDVRFYFVVYAFLVVCYLPSYIALFPGTFGYDGPIQVAQYYGDLQLTAHHPVAHTVFMGLLIDLGYTVFGSYTAGFAIYTALQGLIVLAAVAYSILFCKKLRMSMLWVGLGTLCLVINPFTHLLLFNSTKDVLFAGFLLLFGTEYAYAILEKKVHIGRFLSFGILTCLFRNQGIYIMIALILLLALFWLGSKKLYLCLVIIIGTSQLFFTVTEGVLHIPAGDKKEMFCVPMNQIAYVGYEYGDSLTAEEWRLIEEVISKEGIMSYLTSTADPVKSHFNTSNLMDNFGEHIGNYIRIGLKYPSAYAKAWGWLIQSYWNTEVNGNKVLTVMYTFDELNHWGIKRVGIWKPYFEYLYEPTQGMDLQIWERSELCLWIFIAIVFDAIIKKDRKKIALTFPVVLYFATTLLGPVALIRYLYPVTITTPLLLGFLFTAKQPLNTN